MPSSRTLLPPIGRRVRHVVDRAAYSMWRGDRELPTYLIVGAKRAGTTSLDEYLIGHPLVLRGLVEKGCRYYDVNFEKGRRWFERNLPPKPVVDRLERSLGARPILGESSPYYSFHPLAPRRIAADLPEARLFFALRDPVERAWSHHRYEVTRGFETLTFEEAIASEDRRLSEGDTASREFAHRHFSYMGRSRYAEQIERLRQWFTPAQIMVVDSERLFADPKAVMGDVFAHLRLEPHMQATYRAHKPLPAEAVPPREAAMVREMLEDDIRKLPSLVDIGPRWLH